MMVPLAMRNFFGVALLSLRNQPPMFTLVELGLRNSMASWAGGSVWASISLTRIGGMVVGGSVAPGEPPAAELARQFKAFPKSTPGTGFISTNEKPCP